jgi:hypothetical protein
VLDHLGAYLDHLDQQAPQGPPADRSGQSKSPQEVPQVVGKDEQAQADLVGIEPPAGQPRPVHDLYGPRRGSGRACLP